MYYNTNHSISPFILKKLPIYIPFSHRLNLFRAFSRNLTFSLCGKNQYDFSVLYIIIYLEKTRFGSITGGINEINNSKKYV